MLCTSPVVIINKTAPANMYQINGYHTPDGDTFLSVDTKRAWTCYFPFGLFTTLRRKVTEDNISDFYFFNKSTGFILPIYQIVPCGKCILCRDKKKSEWEFRAICENATSATQPLFVTLTYNNVHLPSCGVFKEEIQHFLKRLRINLTRGNFDASNLRYFACGEYGTKSKRAHYHLILWNFPYMKTLHERLSFVEQAWQSRGFCYVVPAQNGSIGYVMKYMRKAYAAPRGLNKVFFLSSRRKGGIGSAYLNRHFRYLHDNPSVLRISVTDPYTGVTKESLVPKFFRDKLWQSFAMRVPKIIRDNLSLLSEKIRDYHVLRKLMADNAPSEDFVPSSCNPILRKFVKFGYQFSIHRSETPARILKLSEAGRYRVFLRTRRRIREILDFLNIELSDFDFSSFCEDMRLKSIYTSSLSTYVDGLPDIDISSEIYRKKNAISLAVSKEIL